jgi:hypothetical protein
MLTVEAALVTAVTVQSGVITILWHKLCRLEKAYGELQDDYLRVFKKMAKLQAGMEPAE